MVMMMESRASPSADRSFGSDPASTSPATATQPDSPDTSGWSPPAPFASRRIAAGAAFSGSAITSATDHLRYGHASGEPSPAARQAMNVSTLPAIAVGRPAAIERKM